LGSRQREDAAEDRPDARRPPGRERHPERHRRGAARTHAVQERPALYVERHRSLPEAGHDHQRAHDRDHEPGDPLAERGSDHRNEDAGERAQSGEHDREPRHEQDDRHDGRAPALGDRDPTGHGPTRASADEADTNDR
jgi:hypothetical protein